MSAANNITAVDIVPDQLAEVEDVEVHGLTAEQYDQLHVIDLLSAEPGYSCALGVSLSDAVAASGIADAKRVRLLQRPDGPVRNMAR